MSVRGSAQILIFFALVFCFVAESQQKYLNTSKSALSNFRKRFSNTSQNRSLSITGGGLPAFPGQYPFIAFILGFDYELDEEYACAGALIKPDIVITVANCMPVYVDEVIVFLGSVDLISDAEPYFGVQIAAHPEFDMGAYINAIVIIQLYEKVKSSDTIKPIAVSPKPIPCGNTVKVMGYGEINDDGETPGYLFGVSMSVMTFHSCYKYYWMDVDQHFCIESPTYTDVRRACDGDQGNPVIFDDGKLYGLVLDYDDDTDCEDNYPNMVLSLHFLVPWINAMIKQAPKGWS
jgi:secreted trypsin-like serine protease